MAEPLINLRLVGRHSLDANCTGYSHCQFNSRLFCFIFVLQLERKKKLNCWNNDDIMTYLMTKAFVSEWLNSRTLQRNLPRCLYCTCTDSYAPWDVWVRESATTTRQFCPSGTSPSDFRCSHQTSLCLTLYARWVAHKNTPQKTSENLRCVHVRVYVQ